jgi:CRP-like cAMP-binding protein
LARLYKLLPDGRRQMLGFALPGDFLGLAPTDRYNFSADAIDAIMACRAPWASGTSLPHQPRPGRIALPNG